MGKKTVKQMTSSDTLKKNMFGMESASIQILKGSKTGTEETAEKFKDFADKATGKDLLKKAKDDARTQQEKIAIQQQKEDLKLAEAESDVAERKAAAKNATRGRRSLLGGSGSKTVDRPSSDMPSKSKSNGNNQRIDKKDLSNKMNKSSLFGLRF